MMVCLSLLQSPFPTESLIFFRGIMTGWFNEAMKMILTTATIDIGIRALAFGSSLSTFVRVPRHPDCSCGFPFQRTMITSENSKYLRGSVKRKPRLPCHPLLGGQLLQTARQKGRTTQYAASDRHICMVKLDRYSSHAEALRRQFVCHFTDNLSASVGHSPFVLLQLFGRSCCGKDGDIHIVEL